MKEIQEVSEEKEKEKEKEKEDLDKKDTAISAVDLDHVQDSGQENGQDDVDKENSVQISKSNQEIIQYNQKRERRMTAYERVSYDLSNDHKCVKEITLGKRIGFYRIRGELGSGNFSQVKMGIHVLTKEKVAIKILDKTKLDQKTQRLLSREISNMEKVHHPNIIRLYEVVETLAKLHIVMEYAGGGELFNKISNEGKFPEEEAKPIYAQVVAAVQHMHSMNIIHRDLKAENVFYAGPKLVKLGDFGFSTISRSEEMLNTFCGSPPYAAPELFKDESYYGLYVDVWAMGILLYFMVTGIMPFRSDTVAKLKKSILEGQFTIPSYVSDSCQFLIRGILRLVPQDRFTMNELCRSDWLNHVDFPEAHEPYSLNMSDAGAHMGESEKEAHKILSDLGISKEHYQSGGLRDSRSSITGTYRIILHKVHRRKSGYHDLLSGNEQETVVNEVKKKEEKRKMRPISSREPKSKFCTIL